MGTIEASRPQEVVQGLFEDSSAASIGLYEGRKRSRDQIRLSMGPRRRAPRRMWRMSMARPSRDTQAVAMGDRRPYGDSNKRSRVEGSRLWWTRYKWRSGAVVA